tara:strand:+ start:56395 stop:57693 length:1299 start_codon:yes stop_codon:yes gene_type:complete
LNSETYKIEVYVKKIIRNIIGTKNIHKLRTNINRNLRSLFKPNTSDGINDIYKTISENDAHVFFGYYDSTPFNSNETKLLANIAPFINKTPASNNYLKIGYYNLDDYQLKFQKVGTSYTWCWQQGCRLQWYPDSSHEIIIYNNLVDGQYGSIVQEILTGKTMRKYPIPIYDVSRNGKWALSLNFSRLQRLRPGYGYVNMEDESQEESVPKHDGVWRVNLDTGKSELLLSLKEISDFMPRDLKGNDHYINHISINPAGDRFMFFHLWECEGKRKSRLLTSSMEGTDLHVLNDEGHVSHYSWKTNRELLVFGSHRGSGTHYYLYRDQSDTKMIIGKGLLIEDGHPSFSKNGSFILTDTYPDKYGDQHLVLFDVNDQKLYEVANFFSPVKYRGEVRCDLHPRFSPSNQWVCVDSAMSGKREMLIISLESLERYFL